MFFLFIGANDICKVPGLSAAGANPQVVPFHRSCGRGPGLLGASSGGGRGARGPPGTPHPGPHHPGGPVGVRVPLPGGPIGVLPGPRLSLPGPGRLPRGGSPGVRGGAGGPGDLRGRPGAGGEPLGPAGALRAGGVGSRGHHHRPAGAPGPGPPGDGVLRGPREPHPHQGAGLGAGLPEGGGLPGEPGERPPWRRCASWGTPCRRRWRGLRRGFPGPARWSWRGGPRWRRWRRCSDTWGRIGL